MVREQAYNSFMASYRMPYAEMAAIATLAVGFALVRDPFESSHSRQIPNRSNAVREATARPDDEAVLETVLLDVLTDRDEPYLKAAYGHYIYIKRFPMKEREAPHTFKDTRTMEGHVIPLEIDRAFYERNSIFGGAKDNRLDFATFRFDNRIQVCDEFPSFLEPGYDAKALVWSYAPAYSQGHNVAFVSMYIGGLGRHGGIGNYMLRRYGGTWRVDWREITVFV